MSNREMSVKEVKHSIGFLVSNPYIFSSVAWGSFEDRGNACSGRADQFQTTAQKNEYEQLLLTVELAMPKNSELYRKCADMMRAYFGRCYVHYKYAVKLMARFLFHSTYDEVVINVFSSLTFRYEKIKEVLEMEEKRVPFPER